MINFYDAAYSLGLVLSAPFWAVHPVARHKVLCAVGQRMGFIRYRVGQSAAVLIHAVSLGEMNATRELVEQLLSARPDLHIIVTTTTVTGYQRGQSLYGGKPNITLGRFPLDFSSAINRLLDAVRPDLIVLMEGEIWPNFLLQCERRKLPVLLVNGRISESAFARYRKIKFLTSAMLRRISTICAQDQVYADRFKAIGAPPDRVRITGTMKFDTAYLAEKVPGDDQLASELGIADNRELSCGPIWVCGSTGPGEETLLLQVYRVLLRGFPTLRLVIVPRKPERFDEVAGLIRSEGFTILRRSTRIKSAPGEFPVILGDTMGELRKFYSLANVVFVGRSLIDLGSRQWGSDMIEPAALAKPVAVGPWTHNFAEAVRSFKTAHALVEVSNYQELIQTLCEWLKNPSGAMAIGKRAQDVVRSNRGATHQHVELILFHLPANKSH